MNLTTFQPPNSYLALQRQHREWADLAIAATAWDQTFEHAIGTFPTPEFVTSFRTFAARVDRAADVAWGAQLGTPLFGVGQLMKFGNHPSALIGALEAKSHGHVTFKASDREFWASTLDGTVAQLRDGERILRNQLAAIQPFVPPAPNPGVPSGTPAYPGAPTPTPIP